MSRYIRNLNKPKGISAEGYIFDEALGLVIKYMSNFGAIRRRIWDANEEEFVARKVLQG